MTALKIFSHDHCFYSFDYNRSTLPAFHAKLYFPSKKGFSKFAPILFLDQQWRMQVFLKWSQLAMVSIRHYILDTWQLLYFQMLRSILFGAHELDNHWKPSKSTVGYLWGLKSVTPGSIAFISVLVSGSVFYYTIIFWSMFEGNFPSLSWSNLFVYWSRLVLLKALITAETMVQSFRWVLFTMTRIQIELLAQCLLGSRQQFLYSQAYIYCAISICVINSNFACCWTIPIHPSCTVSRNITRLAARPATSSTRPIAST